MTDKTDSKEREAFERAYAEAWHAASSPRKESIDELQYEVSTWREGDSYPDDLPRLRFGWEWWKACASLAANADGCQHESDGCTYTSIPPKNRCKKCGAVYTLGGPQAANAGSEPVVYAMFADNGNIRLWSKARIPHPDAKPLYLHPSPPEGAGWRPIESFSEDEADEVLAWKPGVGRIIITWLPEGHPDADEGEGWHEAWSHKRVRGITHGMLPPDPPTSSADSRKGE